MPTKKTVKKMYVGWIVHPEHGGHSRVLSSPNKSEVFRSCAYSADLHGAKKLYIEHPDGKIDWYKR
jgi:hypothetical protein